MIELRWQLVATVIVLLFGLLQDLLFFQCVSLTHTHTQAHIYTCTYTHLEVCEGLPYLLQGKEKDLDFYLQDLYINETHQFEVTIYT